MQFIETALAFAITMLVLSMVVSTFVELIHRVFSMREAGLRHMLGQMFDQVLENLIKKHEDKLPKALRELGAAGWRQKFVDQMSANRAPMGAARKETPTAAAQTGFWEKIYLWNGRDLASMTPSEFMERLGSIDLAKAIDAANREFNEVNDTAIQKSAGAADAILKDVAQKFEAFGKEASSYFEGRARLMSVIVAVVFAFVVHVDAIDLFRTFLRDPSVRAKIIDQADGVVALQKAAEERLAVSQKAAAAVGEDAKAEVEKLKKDLQAAIDETRNATMQLTDLGVPIGWKIDPWSAFNPERIVACVSNGVRSAPSDGKCADDVIKEPAGLGGALSLFFSLLLGGFLIGLGGPFWVKAVTGLTSLRSFGRGIVGAQSQATAEAAVKAGRTQPITPVGVFKASNAAASAATTSGSTATP